MDVFKSKLLFIAKSFLSYCNFLVLITAGIHLVKLSFVVSYIPYVVSIPLDNDDIAT